MWHFFKFSDFILSLLILVSIQTWCCQSIPTTTTATTTAAKMSSTKSTTTLTTTAPETSTKSTKTSLSTSPTTLTNISTTTFTTKSTTNTIPVIPTTDTAGNKQISFSPAQDYVVDNENEMKTTTTSGQTDALNETVTTAKLLTTTKITTTPATTPAKTPVPTATTATPSTPTPTSTTTYAKQVLTMNQTIDVLLQEVRIFPTTTTLRMQQMLPSKTHTTPIITADIKASRIYESFRTAPDDDDDNNVIPSTTSSSIQRSKRYSVAAHMEATTYRSYINGSSSSSGDTVHTLSPSILRKRTASADMLSRNISIILENLLKSYEQSQLPTHGQGVPTVVRTNILIRSMGPVSELDMDYSMDCYFRQYWRDKRLSFQGPIKSLSLSIKMLDKIWRPDTYFYNGKHSHIHTITVPNKLLRLDQDGGILYSMRLTIKATCPMELKNFPMDRQSCPLIIGSYGYTNRQLVYEWKGEENAVSFVPGMTLNQFDLISMMHRNNTYTRREGDFSVLHVAFNLKRHTGYFLIQVYVPCILIVVLSWVSFWIHREATSDRVGLCITAVLTLSTISLDSRTDLPKVKYATALDWFLLISFLYCIATLLEFAGVHYFTKIGSGEIPISEDEWEDIGEEIHEIEEEPAAESCSMKQSNESICELSQSVTGSFRKRNAMICPIYNDPMHIFQAPSSHASTMERTTQTEPPIISKSRQIWLCFIGDDKFRRQRERDAAAAVKGARHVNSVSLIDRVSRIAFPMSFAFFNLLYWLAYGMYKKEFSWSSVKG